MRCDLPYLMEVPVRLIFLFSLCSVKTLGPLSANVIYEMKLPSRKLVTSQIGDASRCNIVWIRHFEECEVGFDRNRGSDLCKWNKWTVLKRPKMIAYKIFVAV